MANARELVEAIVKQLSADKYPDAKAMLYQITDARAVASQALLLANNLPEVSSERRRPLCEWIADSFASIAYCEERGLICSDLHSDRIDNACREWMPSGSGVDSGTTFNYDESRAERLVFNTAFHHMDQNGYYDGWTDHRIIVTPTLRGGFELDVKGRNRNQIKEYLAQLFEAALSAPIASSAYHGADLTAPAGTTPPDLPADLR